MVVNLHIEVPYGGGVCWGENSRYSFVGVVDVRWRKQRVQRLCAHTRKESLNFPRNLLLDLANCMSDRL